MPPLSAALTRRVPLRPQTKTPLPAPPRPQAPRRPLFPQTRTPFRESAVRTRGRPKLPKRTPVGGPKFTPPTVITDQTPQLDFTPDFSFGTEQSPESALSAALAARTRQQAQAQADAKRKQAAIQFGEGPEGQANPFSQLAVLDRNFRSGLTNLENDLQANNLFYSGFRAKALADANTQRQQQEFDARTRYQAFLADVDAALADALLQADILSAQSGGGGGGGGGGPVPQVARPGEANPAGVPIVKPFDPVRNTDAKYDVRGLQRIGPNALVDAAGFVYDNDGRRARGN